VRPTSWKLVLKCAPEHGETIENCFPAIVVTASQSVYALYVIVACVAGG
jgi:hypothetical protein